MNLPSWLPPLFIVSPWTHETYDLLYQKFHTDFIAKKTKHNGVPIGISSMIEDGREITFWHITTRDDPISKQRLADPRRCERLPWLKPMLELSHSSEVYSWENLEGDGSIKLYVWLKNYDYVAIIKKTRKGYLILLTAYWVEYENTKNKLLKKYNSRIK